MANPDLEPEIRRFRASDGYDFQYRHWKPQAPTPQGFVVALHGIQSHSGWYEYSSRRMGDAGYDVRFLDRRGSGLNEADRGHAQHADRLVNDVVQFLSAVRHERDANSPNVPIVLLGVSWGGKLAMRVAAERPELIDGVALLYPGIRARVRPTAFQKALLRLAMATGKDRRAVRIPLDDPALFTGQAEWQQFIRDDPLALHEATAGLLHASVQLDDALRTPPAGIRCPGLLMLAGGDRIIDNAQSLQFFGALPLPAKRIEIYDAAAHTLEFEPNREQIFSDLIDWLAGVQRVT